MGALRDTWELASELRFSDEGVCPSKARRTRSSAPERHRGDLGHGDPP